MFAFDATFLSPASASVRARARAKERGRDNFSVAHFGLFFVLLFFLFSGGETGDWRRQSAGTEAESGELVVATGNATGG